MKRILVVDDEPDILDLLVEILEGEGYETLAAQDGLAALTSLSDATVDLVITDGMMPRLGGVELIRSMRGRPEFRDIPVILISAAHHLRLVGIDEGFFLPKPFDLTDLLDAVAKCLADASPRAGR